MQIISNIALISINETMIVQVIFFLVFLFIINRIMFRPLQNVRMDRDIHVERIKLEIDEAHKKIESVSSQIQRQEAMVRREAFELKENLEEAGKKQAREIFASVRKEIATLNAKTQKDIQARLLNARKDIKKQSEDLALIVMEKILERSPRS
jgi:F-type H+-transporting ATPase subunit b